MDELDDIIKEFLVESYENLDQLDRDLVALEDAPDDRNRLSSVFRTIHTIKGTCGFLGFPILEHVTHVGENLLVKLRDGELRLNGEITNGLLAMVDAVRTILANIEVSGTEGSDQYEPLVEALELLRSGKSVVATATASAPVAVSSVGAVPDTDAELVESTEDRVGETIESIESMVNDLTQSPSKGRKRSSKKSEPKPKAQKAEPKVKAPAKRKTPAKPKAEAKAKPAPKSSSKAQSEQKSKAAPKPKAEPKSKRSPAKQPVAEIVTVPSLAEAPVQPVVAVAPVEQPVPVVESEISHHEIAHAEVPTSPARKESKSTAAGNAAASNDAESSSESGEKNQAISETTVRLDVALLDRLMNLVGELVLARNQILQFSQSTSDPGLIAASQRLNLITTELQEGVMKTRMQPIRNAWSKLPRVVRDLAQSCCKKVVVQMEGADTELDKTILEAIKDPLTHIVRNSVDHGIEPPEVRVANGKPAEGTLWLRAFHEGGQVNIEIADDGGGINLERVRAKGLEKGLITEEQAASMSDREAMQLILLPGFSTAAKVTNVSGRGVGMDVVKTNVEKIGGTLDINSVAGEGTTLRIKIPLTLAIVPGLVVTCGGDRYCIPQVSLLELVRLDAERARGEIETMHSVPVYRLRGRLLPLVYLDEELGLRPPRTEAERREAEKVNIVVLQAEDRQFGLVVDQITDTQEIVVKPLGQHLKGIPSYAGSTIMGDGTVALILDVIGLARQGHVLTEHGGRAIHEMNNKGERSQSQRSYLIVDPGDGSRAAIPLSSVARLEEFKADQIERSGHQAVVQYRDEIMPLISLDGGYGGGCGDGAMSVVVFRAAERNFGVMVGKIVDIVEHDAAGNGPMIAGTPQIIGGRVTQVIDLMQLVCA